MSSQKATKHRPDHHSLLCSGCRKGAADAPTHVRVRCPMELFEGEAMNKNHTAKRDAVITLLVDTIGRGKHSNNVPIIKKVLGAMKGQPMCYKRRSSIERAELDTYKYIAAMVGSRCIATVVYRHVNVKRGGDPFTELILWAVDKDYEDEAFAEHMTELVRCKAVAHRSATIYVVTTVKKLAFWCAHARTPPCCLPISAAESTRV